MTVLGHGFLVFAFGAVQLSTLPKHFFNTVGLRAVRVFQRFAFCVVLAVNGHPLFSDLARAQPQPQAKEMRRQRVQVHGTMRLVAVQINRDAGNSDVRCDQRVQNNLPPACCQKAVSQPIQASIKQHHMNP